jgi:rod shape-determining protein MreD
LHTVKIVLSIVVALFLQLLLSKYVGVFKYLDLALLVLVYVSLQRAPVQGMLTGLAAGLGSDVVSGGILGVGGFSYTLIGYIISMASVRFSLENRLARLGVVALASIANTLLFVGLYLMLEQNRIAQQILPFTNNWAQLGRIVGYKALADTVAAVFVFVILDRIFYEQVTARRMAIKRRVYE